MWNPFEHQFASVGKDHLIVCNFDKDKASVSKKNGQMKDRFSISAVAWSKNKDNKGTLWTGGSNGKVQSWSGTSISKQTDLGKKAVQSLCSQMIDDSTENLYAASFDSTVVQFKVEGKVLTQLRSVKLEAQARSIDVFNNQMILGLKNGDIVVVKDNET